MTAPRPTTSIRRRPTIVTWLAVVVFLLAGLNIFAAVMGLLRWTFLESLAITLPIWALLLPRGIWAAAWIAIGWGLLRLKFWARLAVPLALLLYQLTFIGQELAFASQVYTRRRLPFALILALVSTAFAAWIITRGRVRGVFNRDTMTRHFDPEERHEPPDN